MSIRLLNIVAERGENMETAIYIIAAVLSAAVLALIVFLAYFSGSPMPVVKRLRSGDEEPVKYPEGCEALKDNICIQKDITYNSDYGKNVLDLYLPKSEGKYPFILWVHGGAFVAGDKAGVENWAVMLADSGYAVASMNYEWAPEAAYPAQVIQITDALKAVQKIANQNGKIDMSRTAIAGDSAGAHMAAQFVLIHTNQDFARRMNISSPLKKDALKCALLYCGPYNLQKMFGIESRTLRLFISRIGWSYLGKKNWRKSPLLDTLTVADFVTENFVPSYITDGNNFSFESHGRELGEKLRSLGVPVAERYFDKQKYGTVNHEYQMDLTQKNAVDCFTDTLQFLSQMMKD